LIASRNNIRLDISVIGFDNDVAMRTPLRSMSVSFALLFSITICPNAGSCQDESAVAGATRNPEFKLQVERNLVLVRVTVRDLDGQPVRDLKKVDFELYDNGKRQAISQFSFEGSGEEPEAVPQPSRTQSSKQPGPVKTTAKGSTQIPEAYVAMYFEDMLVDLGDIVRTREAAERYLDSSLRPNQRVAIFTSSEIVHQDFTADREKLRAALRKLRWPHPPVGGLQEPGQAAKEIVRVMDLIVRVLSEKPGRRTIVLVGEGFPTQGNTTLGRYITEVSDRAVRAGVLINSIDARGLYATLYGAFLTDPVRPNTRLNPDMSGMVGPQRLARAQAELDAAKRVSDGLWMIAEATGGTFFENNNNMDAAFRLAGGLESYSYLLAFSPRDMKQDGKFHHLKVQLAERIPSHNLIVQARRGYYAPGKSEDTAERSEQELSEWVISRGEMNALPVSVKTQAVALPTGKYQLHVDVQVDAHALSFEKRDDLNVDDLTIATAVFDSDGNFVTGTRKVVRMRFRAAKLAQFLAEGLSVPMDFDFAPGTYLVRHVVRESGGAITTRELTVQVP
jgi:VWFA-related protein